MSAPTHVLCRAALAPVAHEAAHLDGPPLCAKFALDFLCELKRDVTGAVLAAVVDDEDLVAPSLDAVGEREGGRGRGGGVERARLEELDGGSEHDGEAVALVVGGDDDGEVDRGGCCEAVQVLRGRGGRGREEGGL